MTATSPTRKRSRATGPKANPSRGPGSDASPASPPPPEPPPPAIEREPKRTRGFHVIRWVERHCVHTNGEWIGRPFRLLGWQKRLLVELFELEWFPDPRLPGGGEWLRRYRWALIGIAKKNGKTELAAALALYLLIGDEEPAPLIACAAGSEDQADLVFGAAKTMVELSQTLSQVAIAYEKEIQVPSIPGARLKRVAAVAGTNDGQNLHAVVCDELHEWVGQKGEQTWNVLTGGGGTRRQPLILQITTAGFDRETVCYRQYEYGKRLERGEIEDPRYFFRWIEAPTSIDGKPVDYRSEAAWEAANPSIDRLVRRDFLRDQLTKKTEATYRRYYLNQWTEAEEAWLPHGAWDSCKAAWLKLDPRQPAYIGIDVAHSRDRSATTIAQRLRIRRRNGDIVWRTVVRARIWANPYPSSDERYSLWHFPRGEMMEQIRTWAREFREPAAQRDEETWAGPAVYYDPYLFTEEADELLGEKINMVETPQTDARMIPASQDLYRLILELELAHDGDETLAAHMAAAIAQQKARGFRLTKRPGQKRPIDAAISTALAASAAQQEPPPPPKRKRMATW